MSNNLKSSHVLSAWSQLSFWFLVLRMLPLSSTVTVSNSDHLVLTFASSSEFLPSALALVRLVQSSASQLLNSASVVRPKVVCSLKPKSGILFHVYDPCQCNGDHAVNKHSHSLQQRLQAFLVIVFLFCFVFAQWQFVLFCFCFCFTVAKEMSHYHGIFIFILFYLFNQANPIVITDLFYKGGMALKAT